MRKKRELCTLDQALYFHRLIILQRYVKPPRPLLLVQPRHRSFAISQVRCSSHAPKGRWGLRAFKRRASAHSSFCVARGYFAGTRWCVYLFLINACVPNVARDDRASFRAVRERSIDALYSRERRVRRVIDRDREKPAKLFGALIDRCILLLKIPEWWSNFGIWVCWIILVGVFRSDGIERKTRKCFSRLRFHVNAEKTRIHGILLFYAFSF